MGIGTKRLVVGAHYGMRDWLVQRMTAVILALFTVLLAVRLALAGSLDYDAWAGLFVPVPMKVATLLAVVALAWHAWIGMRDIWMDYVRVTGLRLLLQVATVVWLIACAFWSAQILWRV
jgi:succinate dehydrogenase / fumarate reductase membrane anchor subunit